MAAYADSDDLVVRYDERTIKDLLSDSGTPVADLSVDTKLEVMFKEATGRINSAIRVGNIYTATQMADFIQEAAGGGVASFALEYLKGITCQIVMAMLMLRRPEKYKQGFEAMKQIEEGVLDPLRNGARLFDMDGRAAAADVIKGDEINTADVHGTRPITHRTKGYYPNREHQLPQYR